MNTSKRYDESPKRFKSTCPYCGVGCGVEIDVEAGVPTRLAGSPDHPSNYGGLCVKGQSLLETTGYHKRLLHPKIGNKRVSWESATHHVANEFQRIVQQHGPDSVAMYVSGQLLTEDYYVANKFMKGYIGTANIDTNSRLCMSSAVAAYKRAFGEDVVPCDYTDLESTQLLVVVGSNFAWTHPILYQRVSRAKRLNPALKVILVDPRHTPSTDIADLLLPIKPGTDAALYNGLLAYLSIHDGLDNAFIRKHTEGYDQAIAAARIWPLKRVSKFCELPEDDVETFYQLFFRSAKVLSFYSQGINQSSSGTDKCQSIINAHLASGKILREGCGPFSITGQPNAMGGREVGGLANQLAAHLNIENPQHRSWVQGFWQSPTIASKSGKMAVDMFANMKAGKIKAVWIMGTNPMVSLPNRHSVSAALKQCEMVVVSDCVSETETLAHATVQLPASTWPERDGTVTNAERRITRQRAISPPPGDAKQDWEIVCAVAKAMGFSGFEYQHASNIFDEWAKLTVYKNEGQRQLNLAKLCDLSAAQYAQLEPQQWPLRDGSTEGKVFENNRFSTTSGKAQFFPIAPKLPIQACNASYPWVMNSGRVRDQWHTMTRTARAAILNRHTDRPQISVHPLDAQKLGVEGNDLLCARSTVGEMIAYTKVTTEVQQGHCFAPIHWSECFASSANVSNIYDSIVDPISGQPESKQAAVALEKATFAHFAQLHVDTDVTIKGDFWVKTLGRNGCYQYRLAFQCPVENIVHFIQSQCDLQGEWLHYSNGATVHAVCLSPDGACRMAIYANKKPVDISVDWLDDMFEKTKLDRSQVTALLHAYVDENRKNGALICGCHNVREQDIKLAIASGDRTVDALGKRLHCGTNCGSCKPELSSLLASSSGIERGACVL